MVEVAVGEAQKRRLGGVWGLGEALRGTSSCDEMAGAALKGLCRGFDWRCE